MNEIQQLNALTWPAAIVLVAVVVAICVGATVLFKAAAGYYDK